MPALNSFSILDAENSEEHMELVGGECIIEDRTSVEHNSVVSEIVFALKDHIKKNGGTCQIFSENVALYVNEMLNNDGMFFLPDVMVVCDADAIDSRGVHKAPVFVAEVTSEATRKNDYNTKLDVYKKIGVSEYWIVDMQRGVVFKYLAAEDYIPQTYMHPEYVNVSSYNGLEIDFSPYMK